MTKREIDQVRDILYKHMDKAVTDLSNSDLDVGWYGENTVSHLAEAALIVLVNQREAQDEMKKEQDDD